jgi:hypothetical protein
LAFQPDILVTSPDEPRVTLVIEAKAHLPNIERAEAEIKRYMVSMQCPNRRAHHGRTHVAVS